MQNFGFPIQRMTGEHASSESSDPVIIENKVGSARTRRASASTAKKKGKAMRENSRPPLIIESSSDDAPDTGRARPPVALRRSKREPSSGKNPRQKPAGRRATKGPESESRPASKDTGCVSPCTPACGDGRAEDAAGSAGKRAGDGLPRCKSRLDENAPSRENNTETGSEPPPASPTEYRIIFKKGSYSKQWILGADDSAEVLYDNVFGKNSPRVIWHEGLLVSRHLSVSENGFFPGTNYVTLSEDDKESVKAFSEVVVQTDGCCKGGLRVPFDPGMTARDVLVGIAEAENAELCDLQLVFNGLLLEPEKTLCDIVEDGDVVDVIRMPRAQPSVNKSF